MNTPEWLRPGIYGALVGAVTISLLGFTWGGWVTAGTAGKQATAMARKDVVAALLPACLEDARTDPARVAKLATIEAAPAYQRRDAVMATGWATGPGSEDPDRDVAQACLAVLVP